MRAIWKHHGRVPKQLSSRSFIATSSCTVSLQSPYNISRLSAVTAISSRNFSSSGKLKAIEAVSAAENVRSVEDIKVSGGRVAEDLKRIIQSKTERLPLSCPGCGAPSQTVAREEAGYYSLGRSGVKNYLREEVDQEDKVMDDVLNKMDEKVLSSLGLKDGIKATKAQLQRQTPICDRCHDLTHHSGSTSAPIFHPTIQSIQSIIQESPHKENHIYHIIDAADFPMSVIPNLTSALSLPRLRTQNRRSKDRRFVKGRVAEVSFIITRSDLLAPQKDQVDSLMPYLRETLRDALGKSGERARLGNVRCVSSKRGWWTKNVKEDVWNRGGAGWMVGKVNVGKSGFFETVFPKGRGIDIKTTHNELGRQLLMRDEDEMDQPRTGKDDRDQNEGELVEDRETEEPSLLSQAESLADLPGDIDIANNLHSSTKPTSDASSSEETVHIEETSANKEVVSTEEQEDPVLEDDDIFDSSSLLPPAQQETQYPVMPIISSLPGTTASPIRVPFGSGRGELIDLPGIARSNLDQYVKPECRDDLVMKTRVTPEQYSIKPGQSLLLGGGLIRLTSPRDQDLVILAYPFVPLPLHVTSTAKAEAIEIGERETGIKSIVAEGVMGENGKIKSAGKFKIQWDVTRKRAGPLTSPSAVKLKPEKLPFIVYSTDVLIEGVGWVELVVQVRKKKRRQTVGAENNDSTISKFRPLSALSEFQGDDNVSEIEALQAVEAQEESPMSTFKPLSSSSELAKENLTSSKEVMRTAETLRNIEKSNTEITSTFKPLFTPTELEGENEIPEIEIFSPEGKFVATRPPMNAWLLGGKQKPGSSRQKSRPRLSMKSLKGSKEGRHVS